MNNPPNSHFSWRRFAALAHAQWLERRRAWAVFAAVGAVLYTLILGLSLGGSHYTSMTTTQQAPLFVAGLMVSGTVFASLYFSALRRPDSALLLLMRPASVLEKWLLAVLSVLLLYPMAYTLVVTPLNALAGSLGYQMHLASHTQALAASSVSSLAPDPDAYATYVPLLRLFTHTESLRALAILETLQLACLYLYATGLAVLGGVYFRKAVGLKTGVLALVLGMVAILMSNLTNVQLDTLTPWLAHSELWAVPGTLVWTIALLWWLGLPMLLWASAARALYERDLA